MPQSLATQKTLSGVVAKIKRTTPRPSLPRPSDHLGTPRGPMGPKLAPISSERYHGDASMQFVAVLMVVLVVGMFATMGWAIWG